MRIWLRTLGLLLMLFTAQAFAQTTTHSVYLDLDANAATGCNVTTPAGPLTGVEIRLTTTVGGTPPQVQAVTRSTCSSGVFGPEQAEPSGYPVGLNLGIGTSDVVELSTPLAGLGSNNAVPAFFVSSNASSADLAQALISLVEVEGGGGAGGNVVPVPSLGVYALLLLTGLIVWRVRRHPAFGSTLVVIMMVGAGVAWAANFISDGQIQDWNGTPPAGLSPSNGTEPGVDIRAVFAAAESGRLHLRVDVRDLEPPVNHAPVLTAATFYLPSGSVNGAVVGFVNASDQDFGQTLTYTITGGTGSGAFAISGTGVVTVLNAAAINFAANPIASLNVSVTDNGTPPQSASATFTVALQTVNHAPTLTATTFNLPENSASGTVVGNVNAVEPDAGQTLTYAITGGSGSSAFAISNTGVITVTNPALLNFEVTPTFSLVVAVSDNGSPSMGASATFFVALQNVNEAPTLAGGTFSLPENSASGTVVGTAAGSDPDGQALTYSITGGNTGGAFAINSSTGAITVLNAAAIDYEVNPNFSLTVSVSDGLLSASATFSVALQDVNEGPVSVDVGSYSLNGTCGILGLIGPGFTLTAGPTTPLPAGTTVTVNGSGIANIGVFSVTGGTANVNVLSGTSRQITLTSAVPAGATIAFRTTLSISVAFTLNATTALPAGYTATGAKTAGSVNSTLILCSAT